MQRIHTMNIYIVIRNILLISHNNWKLNLNEILFDNKYDFRNNFQFSKHRRILSNNTDNLYNIDNIIAIVQDTVKKNVKKKV